MSTLSIELVNRLLPQGKQPLRFQQLLERDEVDPKENKCPFDIL
ncbi:hypothetical protein [Olivibacter ginsenosidimutans]